MAALLLIVAAALAGAFESPLPPPAGTESITITGVKPKDQRKVCRTETPTGSIMSKRICKTVAEWEAQRAASRRAIDELSRQAYQRQIDLMRKQQNRDGTE